MKALLRMSAERIAAMTDNTKLNNEERAESLWSKYREEIEENCEHMTEFLLEYEPGITATGLMNEIFPFELIDELNEDEKSKLRENLEGPAGDIDTMTRLYPDVRRDLNRGFMYEFYHAISEADED